MKFTFQTLQLEAPSLYVLINTWAEMQLAVTETSAIITGYGYTNEIAEAFTTLVLDWEAVIHLDLSALNLPAGTYGLIMQNGVLYACREEYSRAVEDQAVVVKVVSAPED